MRGIPYCKVDMPQRTLGDIQVAAEYLVNAIRTTHARSGRRVAIIGHSQGGMSMRWALRFWPDTRSMVDDVIGFAGSNHGTSAGGDSCRNGCAPASWQQGAKSNFIAALNSAAETFAGVSYTNVYTHTDEVVTPNANDNGSSSLRTGAGRITNVATQDICPLDTYEHLNVGTVDPVAYALAMDALDHDGPASKPRIDRAACTQAYQPGVDPANANNYLQVLQGAPGLLAVASPVNVVGVPTPKSEPALRCYVFAACAAGRGSDSADRCITATAAARGTTFGPAGLGRTRDGQRKKLPGRRNKDRPGIDRFCVTGGGAVEIGYPTARLSAKSRRAVRGRAVLVLASSRRFNVRGIARGARVSTVRRRLRGERRYRVGKNTWYVAQDKSATLVFRTRGGRVGAVGIASRGLTHGSAATRRLLRAWQF